MSRILPIHFAPLQGFTEAPYRNAHAIAFGGVDYYYTPFVRVENDSLRQKDIRDVAPQNNTTGRTVPQLIANTPEKADKIMQLFINNGEHRVDINMGCPFPILARRGNGSGILPHPDAVKSLLSIVDWYPEVEFSVKMRLGWDSADECMNLIPILNKSRLTHITLHPRLGRQQYKGNVDLDAFSRFLKACRHPVIYNGDLHSIDDMNQIAERFPTVSGLMLGRGLLANPALALEWKTDKQLDKDEFSQRLTNLHNMVFNTYSQQIKGGESQLLSKLKPFWEYLEPTIGHKSAKAVAKSKNLADYTIATQRAILGISHFSRK